MLFGIVKLSRKAEETRIHDDGRIKLFVVIAVFVLLAAIYYYNASNGDSSDIPTDLLVASAGLIVGYYFRGK